MSEQGSKLDRLGDILGVDDTAEVERPEPRRGLGEVLSGGAPTIPPADAPPSTASDEENEPANTPPPVTPKRPAVSRPKTSKPAPPRQRLGREVKVKQRTSSTVPVQVIGRLGAARARRWSVNRVITSAVENQSLSLERAEELLERYEGSPRAVCSYRVPVEEITVLDELAEHWRMSRSQVLTVLLDDELERLGF